ncbi:hypothetical protein ABW20_dc0101482 [Dactylellina cionopaga]|nr:hypothetical protein ABW20_dc0101482 [Dactylellina cionopaga]
MAYPMEFSLSNTSTISSVMDDDFTLFGTDDEFYGRGHPLDNIIPFPGDESFTMFEDMPSLSHPSTIEEMDPDFLNPDFFKLPSTNPRSIMGLSDPLPTTYHEGGFVHYLDSNFLPREQHEYPTPPSSISTISSPYSPVTGTFDSIRSPKSRSSRRAFQKPASPPSSPLQAGASSPTGGKPGIFTCPKCSAVFTFKTNKTRHVNSRACEGKIPSAAKDNGCTKEYPCPFDGCPTVIKRRKDNLAVHLKKIHGVKMEVARQ